MNVPYKDPEKQRNYQLQWIKKRRTEWVEQNGPCASCGSADALEVDHIDPTTKSIEPAGIWSLSAAKRDVELAKCQVLCAPCHREKTKKQLATLPPHGTKARYTRSDDIKCRCQLCRDATATYMREWRAAKLAA